MTRHWTFFFTCASKDALRLVVEGGFVSIYGIVYAM